LGMGNAEPAGNEKASTKHSGIGRVEVSLLSNNTLSAAQH
jgi:hypothetical protein